MTGEWIKLHNEALNDLYISLNVTRLTKSRGITWAGHVAHMGERKCMCRILVGKPEGRRPFGRLRLRCEDNIKMNLQEVGWRA